MELKKALDVEKALLTLADVFGGCDVNEIVSCVCFLDDKKLAVLVEASNVWNKFYDANLVDRGEMLGIAITMHDQPQDDGN